MKKKQKFLEEGGQEYEFVYESEQERLFNEIYEKYKDKRNAYYEGLKKSQQNNKAERENIINEVKKLVDVEAEKANVNVNNLIKRYKELREMWYDSGAVAREHYNDLWSNFNHHSERFYDFLEINKELREEHFKRNLEKKYEILKEAEELISHPEVEKAFRRLQMLHRIWKEETEPVAKQYREELWSKFKNITKQINDKRLGVVKDLEKTYALNTENKKSIIEKIVKISQKEIDNHNAWQQAIKEVQALRDEFHNAGKVFYSQNEELWKEFKSAVRGFTKKRDSFYKEMKKITKESISKKKELLKIAKENSSREDWKKAVPFMKNLQQQWKEIGFTRGELTDKMWKEFREVCNDFFDRYKSQVENQKGNRERASQEKIEIIEQIKQTQHTQDAQKDFEVVKDFLFRWDNLVYAESKDNKHKLEGKFRKVLEDFYDKIQMENKPSLDLLRYSRRLENINGSQDIRQEEFYIKKKIETISSEISQLEMTLQLFSGVNEKNPLVKSSYSKLKSLKELLEVWKEKQRGFSLFLAQKQEQK